MACLSFAEVFENQWRWPTGWKDACNVVRRPATDNVPPWSTADGSLQLHPEGIAVPLGAAWNGEWSVDFASGADDQGWRYSAGIRESTEPGGERPSPLPSWPNPVRRRLWRRPYREVTGRAGAGRVAPAPAATASSRSAHPETRGPATQPPTDLHSAPVSGNPFGAGGASSLPPPSALSQTAASGGAASAPSRAPAPAPPPVLRAPAGGSPEDHARALVAFMRAALPLRRPADALPFATLAADATSLRRLLTELRGSIAHVGGDRDSGDLRALLGDALLPDLGTRVAGLTTSIDAGATASRKAAAAVGGGTTPAASSAAVNAASSRRLGKGGGGGAAAAAWPTSSAGSSSSAFDDAVDSEEGKADGRAAAGAAGASTRRLSAAAAATAVDGSAAVTSLLQWERLARDAAVLGRTFWEAASAYASRVADTPAPPPSGVLSGGGNSRQLLRQHKHATSAHPHHSTEEPTAEEASSERAAGAQAHAQALATASEADFLAAMVAERSAAITGISRDVAEVAELYRNLHGLVQEQGELIDVVERNTEQARARVEDGVRHLENAQDYQRAGTCVVS